MNMLRSSSPLLLLLALTACASESDSSAPAPPAPETLFDTLPAATPADPLTVRLTRHGDAERVQFSLGGAPWQMARLCPFAADDAEVGVMACSPQRAGFIPRFQDLEVGPAIARRLHAD